METIKISEIKINPRQRKSMDTPEYLEHIQDLSTSIEKHGLLQPIVLDAEDNLVAGFTRIQAHLYIGRKEIAFTRVGELTEIQAKEMELEENVRRKNLEWWEEANAIAEIHALKSENDPEWSMAKTAAMVGKAISTVSQSVDLSKALQEDETIKTETTLRGALNKRKVARQIEKRKAIIKAQERGTVKKLPAVVKVGDARELIKEEPDASFDAIITNFPFGVDLTYKGGDAPYHDEEVYIIRLVRDVVRESYRVLREDSWFVGFFDIRKITYSRSLKEVYDYLKKRKGFAEGTEAREKLIDSMGLAFWLEQAGFNYVNLLPAIWFKPNKTVGLLGDSTKGLVSSYESAIFACKGNGILNKRGRQNTFVYNTPNPSERVHDVQMPTDLCTEIVSMVTLGGGRVLDPFAGSGAVGLGALNCQCSFVGYELDPEYASNANLQLKEHMYASREGHKENDSED